MLEATPHLIAFMAFAAVGGVVFVAGQYVAREIRVQQRIAAPLGERRQSSKLRDSMNAAVMRYFDEKRFKVEGPARAKLRLELIRAGFFDPNAINYYIFWRLAVVVVVPLIAYLAVSVLLADKGALLKFALVAISTVLAVLGPDAYIARRHRRLIEEYGWTFPDLLDLMVVCVDAGLGLEAALDRISREILDKSRALGMNLLMLGAETRAGRSTIDALSSFSDRLGLDEARSFTATLRQSIELGSDIGDTLRAFSDEMREKRLLRAEERANQLPVKMVLPLGACIFPVVLLVVMLPVIVRLMAIMR
jgi:tight adherence protein C